MNGCIYKLTFPNGKCYIGLTMKGVEYRIHEHLSAAKQGKDLPLYRAIRKYGRLNFKIELLYLCQNKNKLAAIEEQYIKEFDTLSPNGYNCTTGGEGVISPTESARKKMRDVARSKWRDKAYREEQVKRRKELWADPDSSYNSDSMRKKMSDSAKNRKRQ